MLHPGKIIDNTIYFKMFQDAFCQFINTQNKLFDMAVMYKAICQLLVFAIDVVYVDEINSGSSILKFWHCTVKSKGIKTEAAGDRKGLFYNGWYLGLD